MRSAIAGLTLALLVGCQGWPGSAPDVEQLAAAMTSAIARGPGASLSLDGLVPGEWQRVYVFGPYTTPEHLARCLGGDVPARLARGIQHRDDVNLLVFEYGEATRRSIVLSRAAGDFGPEAVGRGYAREEAAFVVRAPPPGSWGELVPDRDLTRSCA